MNTTRINSSIFVTVLSACLCVLAAGAPVAGARQAASGGSAPAVARVYLKLAASASGAQELKLDGRRLSSPAATDSVHEDGPYQNARALTEIRRVLVVTRLARAALTALSA